MLILTKEMSNLIRKKELQWFKLIWKESEISQNKGEEISKIKLKQMFMYSLFNKYLLAATYHV